jgi:hypothetical protein
LFLQEITEGTEKGFRGWLRAGVDGEDFLDSLRFDENATVNQEIKAERLIADKAFVGDRNHLLVGEGKESQL